jgi:hypothetical protein
MVPHFPIQIALLGVSTILRHTHLWLVSSFYPHYLPNMVGFIFRTSRHGISRHLVLEVAVDGCTLTIRIVRILAIFETVN